MKKINIAICTNRDCYIKGTTLFKQLDTLMCATLKSKTILEGADCPGYCKNIGSTQAPCANVDGILIPKASPLKIMQATRQSIARK